MARMKKVAPAPTVTLCKCGVEVDPKTGWHLVLTEPPPPSVDSIRRDGWGLRSAITWLCPSCGPVMFDMLSDSGWLHNATLPAHFADTLEQQRRLALKFSGKWWVQEWEESERGWGVRPDGYTAHRTREDIILFVREMRQRESADQPNDWVPDTYSRPSGEPFECEVPPALVPEKPASKFGFWLPSTWMPPKVKP